MKMQNGPEQGTQYFNVSHHRDALVIWRFGDTEMWATLADGTHVQIAVEGIPAGGWTPQAPRGTAASVELAAQQCQGIGHLATAFAAVPRDGRAQMFRHERRGRLLKQALRSCHLASRPTCVRPILGRRSWPGFLPTA
jgi:hypothetical protein